MVNVSSLHQATDRIARGDQQDAVQFVIVADSLESATDFDVNRVSGSVSAFQRIQRILEQRHLEHLARLHARIVHRLDTDLNRVHRQLIDRMIVDQADVLPFLDDVRLEVDQ